MGLRRKTTEVELHFHIKGIYYQYDIIFDDNLAGVVIVRFLHHKVMNGSACFPPLALPIESVIKYFDFSQFLQVESSLLFGRPQRKMPHSSLWSFIATSGSPETLGEVYLMHLSKKVPPGVCL